MNIGDIAMKNSEIKMVLGIFIILTLVGCTTSEEPLDWGEIFNTEKVCFTIKDSKTDRPVQGAVMELVGYNTPDCITCPIDLDAVSVIDGKACMTLNKEWSCDAAKVTAAGYQPKTINGKPPLIIYLSPIGG